MKLFRISIILIVLFSLVTAESPYKLINPTYLGNEKRNYYGNRIPSRLDIIWRTYLGENITRIGDRKRVWKGSGWTGQPLLAEENDTLFIIHGSLDHYLRKMNARTGEILWEYKFSDAIKGTGTLWEYEDVIDHKNKLMIVQGSRRGVEYNTWSSKLYPLRAIGFNSGSEIWRYNVRRGESYSTDVDGTPLIIDNILYLGLENAYFIVFDPHPGKTEKYNGYRRPVTMEKHKLYDESDKILHGQNLVTESAPARLGDNIYITAGSGHVYAYSMLKREIVWDFFAGSDIDGSPVVTYDNCILVSIEKEYIKGHGGVFKLDPSRPPDSSCVVWYFPTGDDTGSNAIWEGGVIGSPAVNDHTKGSDMPYMAGFTGIDGYFYLVEHDRIDTSKVWGPNRRHRYHTPKFIAKRWVGQSISTPLLVGRRAVVGSYSGLSLFEYTADKTLKRLQRHYIGGIESTPFVFDKRIYVGSKDGYFYCLGEKEEAENGR
ncbi:MAG: PQQ-binding-like beta-propeller repeat protein [Fidelibacterota bacterium]